MNVTLNRWMIGGLVLFTLIYGGDLISPVMKAIAILSAPNLPAI